jgi:sugar lactone lactonase YvrE
MDRELQNPVGAVYRLKDDSAKDGAEMERSTIDNLTLSNGIAWSPDGRAMYVCDSRPGAVLRYEYEPKTGLPSGRRVLIDYAQGPGRPDGCTTDIEGGLWVAEFGAGRVSRYDVEGRLERVVELPVSRPTSVAFGGETMQTLFITTMREGTDATSEALAGCVFVADPDVRGLAASLHAG